MIEGHDRAACREQYRDQEIYAHAGQGGVGGDGIEAERDRDHQRRQAHGRNQKNRDIGGFETRMDARERMGQHPIPSQRIEVARRRALDRIGGCHLAGDERHREQVEDELAEIALDA